MKRKVQKPEEGCPEISPDSYRIEIDPQGPYRLYGRAPINAYTITYDNAGDSWGYEVGSFNYCQKDEPTALCRCGHSKNAPYCDGSHVRALERGEWDPALTASTAPPLERAALYQGEGIVLTDVEELCAFARFCDAKGRVWNQVHNSADEQQRQLAIRTSQACPAGRLKVWNTQTGVPYEPSYSPAVGLIEDPKIGASGPLFVMGGIPVFHPSEAEGSYQPRNRVTLCRCGQSGSKPYCDGTHASAHYHDRLRRREPPQGI